MKYIKYLFLSNTIYSLGLFTNCGEENKDLLVDTSTINDNTDDDSNTILDADGESITDSDLIYIDDNGITIKADILVEGSIIVKHNTHIRHVTYIPMTYVLIKIRTWKHVTHIRN